MVAWTVRRGVATRPDGKGKARYDGPRPLPLGDRAEQRAFEEAQVRESAQEGRVE